MIHFKSILITGGTGSFGKEFVKTLLEKHKNFKRIIIFSRDELKQYEMRNSGYNNSKLRYFIGDVRDIDRLKMAFQGVDVVVHAAALKHVPSSEYNPMECIKTNIIGAENVINAALDCGVKKVIALSTDKAVNPINLYGATKLVAEKLFIQANAYSGSNKTKFSCVRYGNVLGSRGSIIPTLIKQKKEGVITITDPRMTRFWITIEQSVNFVLKCFDLMNGGEVFIPKIPSLSIVNLVKLVAPNSKIKYIGIRPGEKLHEVLLAEDEVRQALEFKDMYILQPYHPWWKVKKKVGGKKVINNFCYSSNLNSQILSAKDLKKILNDLSYD